MSKIVKYGGIPAVVLIMIAIASPGPATESAPARAPAEKASAALSVDAMKLWKDYESNEVAADAMYKGKILEVTGAVASIDKDFLDNVIIHLRSPNQFMKSMATLEDSETSKAAALSKGAKVVLICEGKGRILGSPSLGDCTISN